MTSRMTKEDSKFISVFEPTVTLKDKVSVLKSLNKKDISGSSSTIQEFEDIISLVQLNYVQFLKLQEKTY